MASRSDQALPALEKRVEENPESLAFARLADAYRKKGDVQRAIDICTDGLNKHPDYATGHIILGRCRLEQESFDHALHEFTETCRLDRNNQMAIKMLADIYSKQGREGKAGDLYNILLRMDPENPTLLHLTGLYKGDGKNEVLAVVQDETPSAATRPQTSVPSSGRTEEIDLSDIGSLQTDAATTPVDSIESKEQTSLPPETGTEGEDFDSDEITGVDVSSRLEEMFGNESDESKIEEGQPGPAVDDLGELQPTIPILREEPDDGEVTGDDVTSRMDAIFGKEESAGFGQSSDDVTEEDEDDVSGDDLIGKIDEVFSHEESGKRAAPENGRSGDDDLDTGDSAVSDPMHGMSTVEQSDHEDSDMDEVSGDDVVGKIDELFSSDDVPDENDSSRAATIELEDSEDLETNSVRTAESEPDSDEILGDDIAGKVDELFASEGTAEDTNTSTTDLSPEDTATDLTGSMPEEPVSLNMESDEVSGDDIVNKMDEVFSGGSDSDADYVSGAETLELDSETMESDNKARQLKDPVDSDSMAHGLENQHDDLLIGENSDMDTETTATSESETPSGSLDRGDGGEEDRGIVIETDPDEVSGDDIVGRIDELLGDSESVDSEDHVNLDSLSESDASSQTAELDQPDLSTLQGLGAAGNSETSIAETSDSEESHVSGNDVVDRIDDMMSDEQRETAGEDVQDTAEIGEETMILDREMFGESVTFDESGPAENREGISETGTESEEKTDITSEQDEDFAIVESGEEDADESDEFARTMELDRRDLPGFNRSDETGETRSGGEQAQEENDEVLEPLDLGGRDLDDDEVETIENAETGIVETLDHVEEPAPEDSDEADEDTIILDRPGKDASRQTPERQEHINIDEMLMDDASEDDIDGLATGETIVMDRNALRHAAGLTTGEFGSKDRSASRKAGEEARNDQETPMPESSHGDRESPTSFNADSEQAVSGEISEFGSDTDGGQAQSYTERIPVQSEKDDDEVPSREIDKGTAGREPTLSTDFSDTLEDEIEGIDDDAPEISGEDIAGRLDEMFSTEDVLEDTIPDDGDEEMDSEEVSPGFYTVEGESATSQDSRNDSAPREESEARDGSDKSQVQQTSGESALTEEDVSEIPEPLEQSELSKDHDSEEPVSETLESPEESEMSESSETLVPSGRFENVASESSDETYYKEDAAIGRDPGRKGKPEKSMGASIPDHVLTPTLADIYFQQGQPYPALEIYRRLAAKDPDNERIQDRIKEIEAAVTRSDEQESRFPGEQDGKVHRKSAGATREGHAGNSTKPPLKGVKIKKKVKERIKRQTKRKPRTKKNK